MAVPCVAIGPKEKAPWIGLDIGGANLKCAHSDGWTNHCFFPMWKQYRSLGASITQLLKDGPAFSGVAVTMTGELADCFSTRAEGVASILEQLTSVLPSAAMRVYSVEGQWLSAADAVKNPWSVAASNWHGLARFGSRLLGIESSLLIDVGSTTTDIIPICDRRICTDATTDSQRLRCGSLVYTGVERSSVAGIVRCVPFRNQACPVMNELFATARDVYLWMGLLAEDPNDDNTADGKPATRQCAKYRLARIVGEDGSTITDLDLNQIVHAVFQTQVSAVAQGIQQVLKTASWRQDQSRRSKALMQMERPGMEQIHTILLSGQGDFLIQAALDFLNWKGRCIRMNDMLGTEISRCAPAFAIATLASEEQDLIEM